MIGRFGFALLLVSLSSGALADGIDTKSLPFLYTKGRMEVVHDHEMAGPANQPFYTLAVSPIGSWDSLYDSRFSEEERVRNALQRCEHRAQRKCVLVYFDGKPTGEKAPRSSGLTYAQTVSIDTIPFVPKDVLERVMPRLLAGKPHRAMAISSQGIVGLDAGAADAATASRLALENCNRIATVSACFLYAVDDKVVFTRQTKIYEKPVAVAMPDTKAK